MSEPTSYELDYTNGENTAVTANAFLTFHNGGFVEVVFADVIHELQADGNITAKGTLLKRIRLSEDKARELSDKLQNRSTASSA
ncbi:MAG: hypothetical protein OXE04_02805 [bacterium]|nr:hypothetical protein [bacterium]MCY4257204.1 hypothetical protein [bacterium]